MKIKQSHSTREAMASVICRNVLDIGWIILSEQRPLAKQSKHSLLFKTFSTIQWSSIYDCLIATVMHVPRIVCVCHSTVNIWKCKQQVTELLLHMITMKF
jgi:hypothetical protein